MNDDPAHGLESRNQPGDGVRGGAVEFHKTATRVVVAIIKPFRLEAVLSRLPTVGARHLQHSEARGYGRQRTHLDEYTSEPNATDFVPKVRLEFEVDAASLQSAIEAVRESARTGRIGDGKIFVFRPVRADDCR